MRTFRAVLVAAAGGLTALTAGFLGAAPAGAGLTSPPTVLPTAWADAHAPSGSGSNNLNDVSCTSSSFCMAVGGQNNGAGGGTLTEQWNGSSWVVVPSPNVPSSSGDVLDSVSCVGPAFCLAVGSTTSSSSGVAETWSGQAWTLLSVAAPAGNTGVDLRSVSCVSSTSCQVLGTALGIGGANVIFGNQWNGTSLTATTAATPAVAHTALPELGGMYCVSANWCIAAGTSDVQNQASFPITELWNGSAWTLLTTPPAPTGTGSAFNGVSCAGASFCVAAGTVFMGGGLLQTFVETWNGASWTVTPSANTSASVSQNLNGVDCFSATSCSAVGSFTNGAVPATLVNVWDGTKWSVVPNTPNAAGNVSTSLSGESCVTNWACVAAGQAIPSPGHLTPFIMSAPIARSGYRFVASDGGVFAFGSGAPFLGSLGGLALNAPIVGMAVMPAGDGYYLVASDGGVFTFGSAGFYGSTGNLHLNKPVVGMAVTPDGAGYWLVASDGGIFSYGDAAFYGSTGNLTLNKPVVGMAATLDGRGYYLAASDGGIFSFGDAAFYGSAGNIRLNKPVVGMALSTAGGYWFVASDGGVFNYGPGAPFLGSMGGTPLNKPVVGMTASEGGYYLSASDGGVFTFPPNGVPPFLGSTGNIVLNKPIVGIVG
jgi:hypothetical protein